MSDATSTKPATRISPYWRSLEDLEQSPEFVEFMHREFPQAADVIPEGVSRRRWMQLMGASFALASAQGCRWQTEKIVPFAERPEGYIPGEATRYATNIEWAGAPRHLLVTCIDGRPIKVEGNPDHPASRGGGSDGFSQAATLSLYDPDRQGGVVHRVDGQRLAKTWADVETLVSGLRERLAADQGAGLAVLMQPTGSVAVSGLLEKLFGEFTAAKLYQYEPLGRASELAGASLALGEPVRTHHRLADADVIATFDYDLLTQSPEGVSLARDFADRREPTKEKNPGGMSRLYAVESQYSVTGAAADHRLAVRSSEMASVLRELLLLIESGGAAAKVESGGGSAPTRGEFLNVLAEDLLAKRGRSLVVVGRGQTPEAHALGHLINAALENVGKTVVYSAEPLPPVPAGGIADLVGDIAALRVHTLFILGGNPVYDAPADLDVAATLAKVETTLHLSTHDDETSRACQWSLPQTHPFEEWGDAPAWDGTMGVCQPLIEPLMSEADGKPGCRSVLETLALLAGDDRPAREIVREAVSRGIDDAGWEKLVHDGFLAGSAAEPRELEAKEAPTTEASPAGDLELVFTQGGVYDGRLANNGWLQEMPDFVTKLTWDNAAVMSPATASRLKTGQGKLVRLKLGDRSVEAPVFIQPGQADGSIGLALGYGRTAAGRVGGLLDDDGHPVRGQFPDGIKGTWLPLAAAPVGVNAYALRELKSLGFVSAGLEVVALDRTYTLATTQDHHAIDELGLNEINRRAGDLVREATLESYEAEPGFANAGHHIETLPLFKERAYADGAAWGLAVDLNRCIGCNACSVACQAENNVPVVGKDMVSRGREMHWIRIDRYFRGMRQEDGSYDYASPTVAFQPVMCQQCETAPCEQVCPVAATTHSEEGLNDMVYNRCVGTRYCANNCPFKVRRFNYFHYNWELEQASNELVQLGKNPEVTIRHRGVMEKCTYCVQRISAGRIKSKTDGRAKTGVLEDGEVQTACQQACPTRAIVFGDLNRKDWEVSKLHADPRAYGMLDMLHLKPRTKYLARVRNPHPKLAKYVPQDDRSHPHGVHPSTDKEHEAGKA